MTMDRRSLVLGASTLATLAASGVSESEPLEPKVRHPKERVRGIGGLFFRSHDPKALAEWYQRHLGIDPTPTDYKQPVWQQAAGPTVFTPFPMDTKYFGSPQQAWMVNFRVRNLDAMSRSYGLRVLLSTSIPRCIPTGALRACVTQTETQ
jgi:glyoxylase I family protein